MLSLSDIVNVKVGIGRGVFEAPGATVINGAKLSFEIVMKKLFANGEQGFFYDPNDLSTMFQDAAGITPVTAVGQPVGLIKDKSGRGNHAMQTVSASRPILQRNATTGAYYLAFDGADDFFVVNNFDLTGTSELSLFAGVRLNSSAVGMLLETSANSTNTTGAFGIYAPHISATIRLQDFKSVLRFVSSPNSFVAGQYVLSAKLSQIKQVLRLNDVEVLETRVDTGNYSNHPLYIGRRAGTSFPFNGHIYGLIGIGRLTTDAETIALEKLIAKNTGVTLSV